MTYTDENGEKFESVPDSRDCQENGSFVIVPIKKQPKWGVSWTSNPLGAEIVISGEGITSAQANLIKDAVEALMEYITTEPKSQYVESEYNPDFVRKVETARTALQEGDE